jgi:hypothetical protein
LKTLSVSLEANDSITNAWYHSIIISSSDNIAFVSYALSSLSRHSWLNSTLSIWINQLLRVNQDGFRPDAHIGAVMLGCIQLHIRDGKRPLHLLHLGQFLAFGQAPITLSAVQLLAVPPPGSGWGQTAMDKLIEQVARPASRDVNRYSAAAYNIER